MTGRLLVEVVTQRGVKDVAVACSDQATVDDLLDALRPILGHSIDGGGLAVRGTREWIDPGVRVIESGIRSGDVLEFAPIQSGRWEPGEAGRDAAALIYLGDVGERDVVLVGPGVNLLGRADDCSVVLDDTMASRRHAEMYISDVITIADRGSTNGTLVNGVAINSPTLLGPKDIVEIGTTRFRVELTGSAVSPSARRTDADGFNRPPRVVPPYSGKTVEIPPPPGPPPRQRLPMVSALIPVVLAGVMWMLTKNILSIAFMAMSPLMMIGSWWESRRGSRADHAAAVDAWRVKIRQKREGLLAERTREIERRRGESPTPEEIVEAVQVRGMRLWERGYEDTDFAHVRVGIGDLPSRTTIKVQDGGSDTLRAEVVGLPEEFAIVPRVPLEVDLLSATGIGIAGPGDVARSVARATVARAISQHSPAELVVCAAVGESTRSEWQWLKWVPHVHEAPFAPFPLAVDKKAVLELVAALRAVTDDRRSVQQDSATDSALPHLLVVFESDAGIEPSRIVPVLRSFAGTGVSFIWVAADVASLPRPCGAVVEAIDGFERGRVSIVGSGDVFSDIALDSLERDEAERLARVLAPIVDVSYAGRGSSLQNLVTLPELLGGVDILSDPRIIAERWHESELGSKEGAGLPAPVGMADAPFSIDLRRDGPHALVAGTTGAGKSEFLQSWVAAMAATHSPQRVNFLFVDYKGGAAFKDCIHLPHSVGIVTDLDAHQVERALASLAAELQRREHLLNVAGAKDLVELEKAQNPNTPPNLLIVIDEFAALAKEVPEFVDGVVDIAARGRSLGIHLVLATQRPAGVVTDTILANTNLRVALRVADDAESADVVGSTVAATFSRDIPGRGVARVGPGELIQFQSAFAGAHSSSAESSVRVELGELLFQGIAPLTVELSPDDGGEVEGDVPSDLERLVATVQRCHEALALASPPRPWLDPLEKAFALESIADQTGPDAVLIGVKDVPELQARESVVLNPETEGSWLIVGTSGSGKTALLRTIAASVSMRAGAGAVIVYGLDFGGRGLQMLERLPFVGSIVGGADGERVTRLLRWLEATIAERVELLGSVGAGSLTEYNQSTEERLARVFVLVDGLHAFLQAYERVDRGVWAELFPALVGAGRQVGVHFVLTTDRRSGIPIGLMTNIQRVITLRLARVDDYASAGLPIDTLSAESPPGRGIDYRHEFQAAIPGGSSDTAIQIEAIDAIASGLRMEGVEGVPPIPTLPTVVEFGDLAISAQGVTIGLDDEGLEPRILSQDLALFGIFGPHGAGKTNALAVIGRELKRLDPRRPVIAVVARSSGQSSFGFADTTAERADSGAEAMRTAIERINAGDRPIVLVDDLPDLLEGEFDYIFPDLIRAVRDNPASVIVAGDSFRSRGVFNDGAKELKAAKTGILLQPDFEYDGDLLGAQISRPGGRAFPAGRGYVVIRGLPSMIQVAWRQ